MAGSPGPGPQPSHDSAAAQRNPWWLWLAVVAALLVTSATATLVSFGLAFGLMTDCTNEYNCTETGCAPCATAGRWLNFGWAFQGLLFLGAIVLTVLAGGRRLRAGMIATAALAVCLASLAVIFVTGAGASGSY